MQRIAIIDIGSNSARLVISHLYKNGAYNMVYNQKEALRLSQKVNDQNMLTEEAFSSTIETMKSFAYMCKIYQADKTIAVATAAIRNSQNGAEHSAAHHLRQYRGLLQLSWRYQHPERQGRHHLRPWRRQHRADFIQRPQDFGKRFPAHRRSKHHRDV